MKADYHKEKKFLKEVVGAFGISSNGSRAGVITFSLRAEHSIKMKDHTDINSFNAAVDVIPLMGLTTRIDRALNLAKMELFAEENGGRATTPNILILLTDGKQTKGTVKSPADDPAKITEELRKAGVIVFIVGIGAGTDMKELDHMAGGPGQSIHAATFDVLIGDEFISNITEKGCEIGMYDFLTSFSDYNAKNSFIKHLYLN